MLDLAKPCEGAAAVVVNPVETEVGQRQILCGWAARREAFFGTRHHPHRRPRIPKIGPRALGGERLKNFLAHIPWDPEVILLRLSEDNSVELLVGEVVKAESIIQAEAALEPGIDLAKHLLHLLLVADHHDGDVLPGRAVHQADQRVDCFEAVR